MMTSTSRSARRRDMLTKPLPNSPLPPPLRLDSVEIYHVAMPLFYPWRTAYGEDAAVESVLVRLHATDSSSGQKLSAWGETSPFAAPCYSPEWAGGIFAVVRGLARAGHRRPRRRRGDDLHTRCGDLQRQPVRQGGARHRLVECCESHATGKPLHRAARRRTRDVVPVGADFGVMDSIDDLLAAVGKAVERRLPADQAQVPPRLGPADAARPCAASIPTQTFHIDCNSGYRLSDLPLFRQVDEFNLAMIEQPLAHDDLVDHAELQAADQHAGLPGRKRSRSLPQAEQAIALKSCRYVNIKPGRVGGLTNAVTIHDLCRAGRHSLLGRRHARKRRRRQRICVALAMLDNFTYPADIFPFEPLLSPRPRPRPLELTPSPDGTPTWPPTRRPVSAQSQTRRYWPG